jgi:hypothetical protein
VLAALLCEGLKALRERGGLVWLSGQFKSAGSDARGISSIAVTQGVSGRGIQQGQDTFDKTIARAHVECVKLDAELLTGLIDDPVERRNVLRGNR